MDDLKRDIETIKNAIDMREPENMDKLDHRALDALGRIEIAITCPLPAPVQGRAIELLDRIETQCKTVGYPVGGIDELKGIYRALSQNPAPKPAEGARKAKWYENQEIVDEAHAYASGHAPIADLDNNTNIPDTLPVEQRTSQPELTGSSEVDRSERVFNSDIEQLKREVFDACFSDGQGDYLNAFGGAHAVIDHLASRRLIGRGWMPIETAPKDGTQIMIFVGGDIKIARWDKSVGLWFSFYTTQTIGSAQKPMKNYVGWKPTHWQPLPAAPDDGGE